MEEKSIGNSMELEFVLPKLEGVEKKLFKSYWSSPEKFSEHIRNLKLSSAWHTSAWSEKGEFYGTKTLEEALDLSANGWKEGADKIEKILNKIKVEHPFRKQPTKFGIVGSVPDVARAVSGNPLNMKAPDLTKSSKRPIITILSDMGAHCEVSINNFINRAAVVTAVIDRIEEAGYACDVYVYAHSKGGGWDWMGSSEPGTVMTAIQLKNSNQPLDIARMSFGIGHPAMFRRLTFADWGGDNFNSFLGRGLGHTQKANYTGLNEKSIFYLPSVSDSVFETEQSSIDLGINTCIVSLKEQGFKGFGPLPEGSEEAPILKKKKKAA